MKQAVELLLLCCHEQVPLVDYHKPILVFCERMSRNILVAFGWEQLTETTAKTFEFGCNDLCQLQASACSLVREERYVYYLNFRPAPFHEANEFLLEAIQFQRSTMTGAANQQTDSSV